MTTKSATAARARHATGSADPLQRLKACADAFSAEEVTALERRVLAYLQAGQPVHLRGPTGSGKTTLALHIAQRLQRPIMLVVGGTKPQEPQRAAETGGRARTAKTHATPTRAATIRTGTKATAPITLASLDEALAVACRQGLTLVYDAFDRAAPDANLPLLPVLEEHLLTPGARAASGGIAVHANFRAIFTSNPQADALERAGAWEALTDRMITLDLDEFSRGTEIAIVAGRTGLPPKDVARIVDIVRDFRHSNEYAQRPTLRASIMIGGIAAARQLRITAMDADFVQLCLDVLGSKLKPGEDGLPDAQQRQLLIQLIDHFCGRAAGGVAA
jgi:nitric oxide reductase NorQ protein